MSDYIRVTDEIKPKRTYTIRAEEFIDGVHTKVENQRDPALDHHGEPAEPRYYTTPDAEAAKKKTSGGTESSTKSGQ